MVCNLTAVTLVKSLEATDCRTQNSMLSNWEFTDSDAADKGPIHTSKKEQSTSTEATGRAM